MMTRIFAPLITALTLLIAALPATPAWAQRDAPLQPEDAFALTVHQDKDDTLVLNWRIADGYYLYRSGFAADMDGQSLPLSLPEGEVYEDPYFGEGQIYRDKVSARLTKTDQPVILSWQGCQQDGICYAPQRVRLGADGAILPAAASPAAASRKTGWSPQGQADPDPAPRIGVSLAQDDGLVQGLAARGGGVLVIAGFLGFGLLLAFTPCVFPMFPIVVGMLAGQGATLTPRRGLILTGAYVLAMAGAFGVLGVVAAWSGANLQMALQSPLAIGAIAVIFVALALSMFGFYELQMPQALQNRLDRVQGRRGSVSGAMALGFTSALIVGPCVTAPLAGALLYIAQTGDVMLGAAALFALGLGQGLPLLAIGVFGPRILPRRGGWMENAKRAFGVIFLGFAIWLAGRVLPGQVVLLLWAALLVGTAVFLGALDRLDGDAPCNRRLVAALGVLMLFAGLMQGFGAALGANDPLRPLAPLTGKSAPAPSQAQFAQVSTRAGLDQALQQANGRPVLLYLTADWCVTCRVIERGPLADPAVQAALADIAAIKLDVSDFNREAQALMQELAAAGPPTMIFLDPGHSEAPDSRLIGQMDSAALLASIAKVTR